MRAALALAAVIATVALAGAQAPVVNARLERHPVTQGLTRDAQAIVDRGVATWIGYSVPILRRTDASLRSTDWCCGRCRLEPPTELVVLARAEKGAVIEIRSLAVDCDLDAGGMPLAWLDGVTAGDSVAWLASFIRNTPATPRDRMTDAALTALSLHASPGAAAPLVRLTREGASAQLRTRALTLLARRPAEESLAAIDAAIEKDPDRTVRRQAVTALGRLPGGAGIPRLIEIARAHADADVRKHAMQSLGQSRDPRATDFFTQVLK